MKKSLSILVSGIIAFSGIVYAIQAPHIPIQKLNANGMPLIRPDNFRGMNIFGNRAVVDYDRNSDEVVDLQLFYPLDSESKPDYSRATHIWIDKNWNGFFDKGEYYFIDYENNSESGIIPNISEPRENGET